jgi:carbonic anhydrase
MKKTWLWALLSGLLIVSLLSCEGSPKPVETTPPVATQAETATATEVVASHESAPHWSYTGETGPEFWYSLDAAYTVARDGKAQSPIGIQAEAALGDGAFTAATIQYQSALFEVENNGHTIEIIPEEIGEANAITLDSVQFILQQAHFHAPSEHTIDGVPADMELHLVHRDANGNLAVIGILINEGEDNAVFGELFASLPAEGSAALETPINLADLFTGVRHLFRYDGSLTTPPCTEGVKWSVAVQPITAAATQIEAFTALYSGNNRPIQPLNERPVYLVE